MSGAGVGGPAGPPPAEDGAQAAPGSGEPGEDRGARRPTDAAEPSLEARLRRLEAILGALESDELELERALALFEEGVRHVREAEQLLVGAELRVEELLGGEGGPVRPFPGEGEPG